MTATDQPSQAPAEAKSSRRDVSVLWPFLELVGAIESGDAHRIAKARSRLESLGWSAAPLGGATNGSATRGSSDAQRADPSTAAPAEIVARELTRTLQELVALMPGLRQAIEAWSQPTLRQAIEARSQPQLEPIAYRKRDAAKLCSISPRLLERLLSAGKFPKPDAHAGRCPLWT
jgi:hypothetical protein